MKTLKYTIGALFIFLNIYVFAQEETVDKRPVRSPFEVGLLLENQTMVLNKAKTLDFIIQHRFGALNSEDFDLIGLYAPSNIRIGLTYGITNNINVGVGTTKNRKLQDVNWKYAILKQTRSGTIPISITYWGNVEFDLRKDQDFGMEYQTTHRMSYLHEIMIGRKFSPKLTVQLAATYSHFNQIDTTLMTDAVHDNISLSLLGRYKVTSDMGVIFGYDFPLTTPEEVKPGVSLGLEIGTSAHAFQVFLTTNDAISRQTNHAYNRNDLANGDMRLGFNITRLWYF